MPDRPVTPGTVAVSADQAGRYTQFTMSIHGLMMPTGSQLHWKLGSDVAANRNSACESMVGDWLFFMDDDHAFPRDILYRLLHADMDIVAPVVLRRVQPFHPVACDLDGDHLDLSRCPTDGLIEVEHTGSAGMLIRRHVLEAIEPPWFELGNGISEDVNFCRKARAAGFNIHVGLGARMGHITTCAVWPAVDNDRWATGFRMSDGFELVADMALATI